MHLNLHRRALLFTLFTLLSLGGCQSAIPRVPVKEPPFTTMPRQKVADLSRGRTEYIAKCSGCHQLYRPGTGDEAYWNRWVDSMAERSHLSRKEKGRIKSYLFEFSDPKSALALRLATPQ